MSDDRPTVWFLHEDRDLEPRPLFASYVRQSTRRLNRNAKEHIERGICATMPYRALEDAVAFHEIAEQIRLQMIAALLECGAPINVWRVGQHAGLVAATINYATGEAIPWKDAHQFLVRTRASVEHPPYELAEEETTS